MALGDPAVPGFPKSFPIPTCTQQSQGIIVGCFNYLRSLLLSGVMSVIYAFVQTVSRQASPCALGRLALVH